MDPAQESQPSFRRESPSPSRSPTLAIGAGPELYRCISTGSTISMASGGSNSMGRESMGSTTSSAGTSVSRSSSASYAPRQSMGGSERPKRRGYVKPQGTYFSESAKSRESVLNLGSIAHLQYYFARTGLLDGKGGRLARKRANGTTTLDLSALDTSFLSPKLSGSDVDSSYASMGNSPELTAQLGGLMMESPTQEEYDDFSDEEGDEGHPHMLPPTVSTYNQREKPLPRPPSLEELKQELHKSLAEAIKVLEEAKQNPDSPPPSPPRGQAADSEPLSPTLDDNRGWYELQGMHILDIMTLAIRAAKIYYTAHDQPTRLSAIKSERKIRSELLEVMDVLRRMATRNFQKGMHRAERETMERWVAEVYEMLRQEEDMEEADRRQRASWTWLQDDLWEGRDVEREYAFIKSMDPEASSLPEYQPLDDGEVPTAFLKDLSTGLRLVQLHNAIVKKSKRTFGAIDKWHTDFAKPYRSAENLRWWIKAAELRWEVVLKVDVLAVVNGTDKSAWKDFEDAIWKWCGKVRQEIAAEIKG